MRKGTLDRKLQTTEDMGRMKKAVFFDVDGTLWNWKMEIPESTVKAIRKLRENGHYAFICSGRSRSNIRSKNLLDIGFDGVVASCGTHIDFHKETVFEVLLTTEQITHALDTLKKHHMPVVLEGPKYIYVNPDDFLEDPYVIHLRKELGEDLLEIPDDASQIFINKMSTEVGDADAAAFIRDMGEDFDIILHETDQILEINPKGYSKATGIQKVCEILGIDREDTYAFGDSENDLEMLEYVAHGVAMGNAAERAKGAAEYVTKDLEEDGIEHGLRHYGLID